MAAQPKTVMENCVATHERKILNTEAQDARLRVFTLASLFEVFPRTHNAEGGVNIALCAFMSCCTVSEGSSIRQVSVMDGSFYFGISWGF